MRWCWLVPALVAVVACSGAAEASPPTGSSLNSDAIKLATEGKLQEALELFEQAVRLSPSDSGILNNLGVTYMRMQRSQEAKDAFLRGLRADPHNEDCLDNLKVLLNFTKEDLATVLDGADLASVATLNGVKLPPPPAAQGPSPSGKALGEQGIRHTVRRLPRIPAAEFYLPENRDFAEGRRPFILTGLVNTWPNISTAFSFDALAAEFPQAPVDFYSQNMRVQGTRPYIVPLPQALQELQRPSGNFPLATNSSMYVHWNVRWGDWRRLAAKLGQTLPFFTSDEAWLEGCLASPRLRNEHLISTHWRMLLIANQGGGMFNHKDTLMTSSFQYQLRGRKKWHLCSPANDAVLEQTKPDGKTEEDMFHPDYHALPDLLQAECYVDTAHPGEALFYPREYWHQTVNLDDPVVAITGTLVDANNYDTVALMLDKDCEKEEKIPFITPSAPLCQAYRTHCFPWWRHAFGDVETMYAAAPTKAAFDKAPTMVRPFLARRRDVSQVPMQPTDVTGEFACPRLPPFSPAEAAEPEQSGFYG